METLNQIILFIGWIVIILLQIGAGLLLAFHLAYRKEIKRERDFLEQEYKHVPRYTIHKSDIPTLTDIVGDKNGH